ncbi:uncharacterized protein [Montipora capricornis]|uniref:uncharacterized protein n=1 Tax=Montipora capricornis TaxID=246305 RepID=UPI0035F10F20
MSINRGIFLFIAVFCIGNFAEAKPYDAELTKGLQDKRRGFACYDRLGTERCLRRGGGRRGTGCEDYVTIDECPVTCDACRACGDIYGGCSDWAKRGLCRSNAIFMYRWCRRSCVAWNWC